MSSADELLVDLNEPQVQAVRHRDGPLLVLAGPGSGKTRVITRRAAYLVHTGVSPRNILAITFTNKAAEEMRRRIEALGVGRGMWVYTFHALGARLLRELGPLVDVQPGFTIYDEDDQLRLIKESMALCQVSPDLLRPEEAQARVSRAKNALHGPDSLRESRLEERLLARVFEQYEKLLRQRNAVDFDDLLMRIALLLSKRPDVAGQLATRFQYLLIDEYQDTNHAQYLIARHLAEAHRNICATGDPDQSIYGWRGADLNNILEFEHDYPDAVVIRLEQNYRSVGNVLAAAGRLISVNRQRREKALWTQRPAGDPVRVREFDEGQHEAEHVADTIAELHRAGRSFSDVAVIYRVNAISRGLEEALRARGIPYKVARGIAFYGRREIRDAVAYLRLLVNPADDLALLRIINTPTRGIGDTTTKRLQAAAQAAGQPIGALLARVEALPELRSAAARLRRFAELLQRLRELQHPSVAETVRYVIEESGLRQMLREEGLETGEDRIANVDELVTDAARYESDTPEPSLGGFLERVALASDQDQVDQGAGVVMLLTLHAAKGLEFPVVFIVGLEQGMLPHERSLRLNDVEEERRLCFVGMTRAQDQLYLSHARQRVLRGVVMPRSTSQFLLELPDEGVLHERFGPSSAPLPMRSPRPQVDEYADPPAERSSLRQRSGGRSAGDAGGERVISFNEPTSGGAGITSRFADWQPGTLVVHADYGTGQLLWIRPSAGQTRGAVRFPVYGEKTFVFDHAPILRMTPSE